MTQQKGRHAGKAAQRPTTHPYTNQHKISSTVSGTQYEGLIDFDRVNRAALVRFSDLLLAWLPNGQRKGQEFVALNPTRADRSPGSFTINVRSGVWADFATGDRGGDPTSLRAYLRGCSQSAAAREIAHTLGLNPYREGPRHG